MTCLNPKIVNTYWTTTIDKKTGEIRPTKGLNFNIDFKKETQTIPCGKCEGCRISKSQDNATKAYLESTLHEENCFLTLTYDNEHLPKPKSLNKRDMQLFWKKLRKKIAPTKIKYLMCGEYGLTTRRPHYHAIIFGYWPPDTKPYKTNALGQTLFTSEIINKIWGNGFCMIGLVNYETAAYVARYVYKKAYGSDKLTKKLHQIPEYTQCSKRPAIAKNFLPNTENFKIIERNDGILIPTINGPKIKPIPQYLRNWWKSLDWKKYFAWTEKQKQKFDENKKQILKKTDKNAYEYQIMQNNKKIKSLTRLDKYRNSNIDLI